MSPLIWTPEDALALRCRVEEVGTLRESQDVLEGRTVPAVSRQRISSFALAHLCRIAQGFDMAAVAACRELLARCPPEPEPAQAPAQAHPEWLTAQRLAYQAQEREAMLTGPQERADAPVDNL